MTAGAAAPAPRRGLTSFLLAMLLCWGVGVQFAEGLASVGLVGCAVGGAIDAFDRRSSRGFAGAVRAWAPLLAFSLWALVAPLWSAASPTATGVARLSDWWVIPFAVRAFARQGSLARLAWGVGAVAVLSSVVAGFQHFGVWPNEQSFAPLAWTRYPFYRVYEPVAGSPGRYMAGGLLSHRLKFAHVEGLVALAFLCAGLRQSGRWRALCLGVAGAVFVAVLWFPYARMASAALVVAGAAALILSATQRRKAAVLALALAALCVGAVLGNGPLRERFFSGLTSEGSGDRDQIWAAGLRAVREHPLVGVGWGQFRPSRFADQQMPAAVIENPGKAHNQLLSIAAEGGLPGLALFGWLLWALARRFPAGGPLGAFGLSAMVFFLGLGLTHDPLYQAPFSMALTRSPSQRSAAHVP